MLRKARKNTMGLFNFDNTLDWVGKNESDGEIFYGYNNGEGRNMKLVERQIDLIKKIIDLYEKFACLHNYHNPNRFFKKVVIK